MNARKLQRIFRRINELRNRPGNVRSRELRSLAVSLGRKKRQGGRHDIYISELEGTRSLPIPSHSRNLPKGTALNILNDLEQDAFIWRERLGQAGGNKHGE